MNKICKMKN